MEFNLEYYKENAEENYITTPISVLRYISELESHIENSCAPEMLEMLKEISEEMKNEGYPEILSKVNSLIKKATEL